jgi:4-amino-4-deoxy-L-arabinose transferase-like glycosyltransferase
MKSRLRLGAIFAVAFAILSANVWSVRTADGWIDPVAHFGAQDEATYTSSAIHMILSGDWMTPTLLGRWIFEKPPLVMWLSGASMALFGIGPFTSRIPALIAGALIVCVCFAVAARLRSPAAGLICALLAVSDQVLFTLSRRNMTDILLAAAVLTALAAVAADLRLDRGRSQLIFVLSIAAGILAKSIGGLLPAMAAALFAAASGGPARLRLCLKIALLTSGAVILASPWFVYNLVAHTQWFLADTGMQIFSTGLRRYQTSSENHLLFYLVRLAYAAPAAALLFISGLPGLARALRRRDPAALLLTSFLVVLGAALAAFHFHSEQYLTPVMPVIVLTAAVYSPLTSSRPALAVIAALAVVFVIKAANPDRPWGISFGPDRTIPSANVLSAYCEERRANALYILAVDDEFYALALPIPRLRYGWLDPEGHIPELRPYLVWLGVVRPVNGAANTAAHSARLHEWGFPSDDPIGTALTARSIAEFAPFVLAHPEADFLIPPQLAAMLPPDNPHIPRASGPGYVLLESRVRQDAGPPRWTCRM